AVELADPGDLEVAGVVHDHGATIVGCREATDLVVTAKVEPTGALGHQARRHNPAVSNLCNGSDRGQSYRVSCFDRGADDERSIVCDNHVAAIKLADSGDLQVTDVVHAHGATVVGCLEATDLILTAKVEPTGALGHQVRRHNPSSVQRGYGAG